nr:hypothetical protein [Micromonospora sp. DSM 115978]
MFLDQYVVDEAHILMRVGIVKLNAAHGLVETAARGYHETMTRCWLALVDDARRSGPVAPDSAAFLALNAERLSAQAPLRHYSRDRLFGVEARARFVEPDLVPLPG